MPTLNINGQRVKVDDSFLSLSPDQQNATVDEIAQSLGGAAPVPQQPNVLTDVAKSAGAGLAKGAIGMAGLIPDVAGAITGAANKYLIDPALDKVESVLGIERKPLQPDQQPPNLNTALGSQSLLRTVQGATGEFHKPQTTAGQYAETVGEFAPGMIGGAAGLGRRFVTQVLAPGVGSEFAGQKTKGTELEPYARIAGAILGGAAPSVAARAITPLPTNAGRMAAVNTLRNEGVTDLTAGQATGRKGLQYLEAERGGAANLLDNQGEQFTSAALRRVGENANRATPEVVDRAFNRIGQEFDDLASRNSVTADRQLVDDSTSAVGEYYNLVSPPNRTPAVTNFLQEMTTALQRNGGTLPGDVYQSLRSRIERAARGMGNNPEARTALRELRESIDDAMERSIQASGNTADLGAWRNARRQYRNLLVIERAATGAGENAALGLISPAKLREATVGQNRRAYARGQGDFADLARSGVSLMSPLPNSGTPGRLAAQNLGTGVSSVIGAMTGSALAGPVGGGAGAIAGALLPHLVGRAATSRPGRAYLTNQIAAQLLNGLNPRQSAVVNALLAAQQPRLNSR